MAVQFYVEQADRSYLSGVADETVKAGVLVTDVDGGGVRRLNFADNDYSGLAVYDAEVLAAEDHDVGTTAADFEYSSDDRLKYQPAEDGAIVKIRTIVNGGDTTSAPSIGHRDVVGIVDETDADAPAPADCEGRIVEEGFGNDAGGGGDTTYNRSNNNFLAVGRAHRPGKQQGDTVSAYDEPVRVVTFETLRS